jgi:hypothetical protein
MSDDSIDDIYTGSSLTAKDLKGRTVKLTIKTVVSKRFDDGGVKLILSFEETDRTLVLNKTNAKRIAESHGKVWTRWDGKVIKIHPERVEFKGDIVDAIRVDLPEHLKSESDDEEAVDL